MMRWGTVGTRVLAAALAGCAIVVGTTGPAWSQTDDNERLVLVASSDSGPGRVVGSGAVSGPGTFVTDEGDDDDRSVNTLTFAEGTLVLVALFENGTSQFNAQACMVRFTSSGRFVVAGGTGRFAGASGEGRFVELGTVATARTTEGCSGDTTALAIVVQAAGTLRLSTS
jgi:hypothetical protein